MNIPRSIDQVRAVRRLAILSGSLAVIVVVLVIVVPAVSFNLWLAAMVILGVVLLVSWMGGLLLQRAMRSVSRRFAAVRQSAREPAIAAGWTFAAEGAAPSRELSEAVFMQSRQVLRADHTTEVITGERGGYSFRAAHIDGYTTGFGDEGPKGRGTERAENVVILTLPGLLPELKLKDRLATRRGDYGLDLPAMASGHPAVDARWEVQSSHPDAARIVLGDKLLPYLATVPGVPCTIVFRNGQLIASRDPEATFASIRQRLDILTAIADRVPQVAWNSVSPEVAGLGAHPVLIARSKITMFRSERTPE